MSYNIDLNKIVNSGDKQTNFSTMLLKLVFKADRLNRAKLARAFPNAVEMVERFQQFGEILDLEDD